MERGRSIESCGDRHSARGAEATSATREKAALPLASSPGARTEGAAGGAGINGRLEQPGREQGRGFPEWSARGVWPIPVCASAGWVAFLSAERYVIVMSLPQEA
jgi:hypothetical protein